MKRDVTIRALLQRERRLHPERHPAATAAVFGTSVHRWVKGSIRPGIATAARSPSDLAIDGRPAGHAAPRLSRGPRTP